MKGWPRDTGDLTFDANGDLIETHPASHCHPPCPVHSPSEHHMTEWPLIWRGDRRIFERRCQHGVGHPDPDTLNFLATYAPEKANGAGVHGCDGCCAPPRAEP